MNVLGIETTCDETGASIVVDGKKILSNVVVSSSDIHKNYGGVFPELACRRHIEVIEEVIEKAIQKAQILKEEIGLIAVASMPGLIGALLIGMNVAKGLSISLNIPFVCVNHVEAHLYASMMEQETLAMPSLGICLSGGHTFIVKIIDVGSYEMLSTTVDDAIGEAFDKVASLLKLPYPGGPWIEKLALKGNPKTYPFKAGRVKRAPLDFSFSGLKTSVLYQIQKDEIVPEDVAASFQETAFRDVAKKAKIASQMFPCQAIFLGGGVTANNRLKEILKEEIAEIPLFFASKELTLDNAAMIAGLGYKRFLGQSSALDSEASPRIPIA